MLNDPFSGGSMINWKYNLPITSSWFIHENDIGYCGKDSQNFILQWLDESTLNTMRLTFKLDERTKNYTLSAIEIDLPKALKNVSTKIDNENGENLKLLHHGDALSTPTGQSYRCDKVKLNLTSNWANTMGTMQFYNLQFEVFTPNQTHTFSKPFECIDDSKWNASNHSNSSQSHSITSSSTTLTPLAILVLPMLINIIAKYN